MDEIEWKPNRTYKIYISIFMICFIFISISVYIIRYFIFKKTSINDLRMTSLIVFGIAFILMVLISIYSFIKKSKLNKTIIPGFYSFSKQGIYIHIRPFDEFLIEYKKIQKYNKGLFNIITIKTTENNFKILLTEEEILLLSKKVSK